MHALMHLSFSMLAFFFGQRMFKPLVLIAAYCCFATPSMSTPAMSTPATWCHDVHSCDFRAPDNCTFQHIHFCIHTLSGAVLPQELVDSNIEQERSDLNLRQMSNQMQQVLGGVGDFHQLSSK